MRWLYRFADWVDRDEKNFLIVLACLLGFAILLMAAITLFGGPSS